MSETSKNPENPTISEQGKRLHKILAENMRVVVADPDLFKKIMDAHKVVHPGMHDSQPMGDVQVVVGRTVYGRRT